jgi:hypothetical protein
MYRSAARISLTLAALAAAAPAVSPANDVVPAAAAGVPETPAPPKCLVMNNGDLVEGPISRTQTGYELAQPGGGRIFLAEPVVWFAASSRSDAYEELRKRFPDQSAGGHVALARWCLRYGLDGAAKDQLRVALTIDPDHREARNTIKLLGDTSKAIPDPTRKASVAGDPAATLGGLPAETARAFVTTVQPLLVNSCGNASCHGTASKGAFTIQNVRSHNPAFKALTQRNLETVLARISSDDPAHSDIFMLPQQPGHGGSRRPILTAIQLQKLRVWGIEAARAMPAHETSGAQQPILVLTSSEQPEQSIAAPADRSGPSVTKQVEAPVGRRDVADVLRQAIAEERADAFDPREFNRRFGSDAGRPSPPASEGPKP